MFRWAIPKVDIIHILAIHIMGLIKREHGRGGVESRQLFIQSAHAYVTPSLFISFFPFSLFVNSRLLLPIDLTNTLTLACDKTKPKHPNVIDLVPFVYRTKS